MNNRFKHKVDVIRFPKGFSEEERGYEECCVPFLVLADLESNDTWKNDFTGVYVKASSPSDIVSIIIQDFAGNDLAILGQTVTFPHEDNMTSFIFEWKQYLANYGAGCYKIFIKYTISGVNGFLLFGAYELKPYSVENAMGTVRISTVYDSFNKKENIDFTDSVFKDTVRFNGFFGGRKLRPQIEQLIDVNNVSVKTTREYLNQYELFSDPLNFVHWTKIVDGHLINEDECFISDHNAHNHSYQYLDLPVVLDDEIDATYYDFARTSIIIAKFGDRVKNQKTFYNKR
jgi:hypothetical protein